MFMTIDPSDARPIYQQIMDEVRRAIVVGTLRPNDALPSVRQCAADLRLNPNTVQQAYRELEREGIVHVRRGRGTFVTGLQSTDRERKILIGRIATETLQRAYRYGLDIKEVIDALQRLAEQHDENSANLPEETQ